MALRQIFKTQLTDVDSTARDVLGSLRWENDTLYRYVLCDNVSGVAFVAGDPLCWKATHALGVAAFTVTSKISEADAQPQVAGFAMATVTSTQAAAGVYIWVQLTGAVTVPTAITGTPVIGSGVMMGAADKTLALVTGVIHPIGVSTSTTAANNTIIAKVPF